MKKLKSIVLGLSVFSSIALAGQDSNTSNVSTNNFLPLRFQEPKQVIYNQNYTNNFLPLRFVPPKNTESYRIIYAPKIMIKEKGVDYGGER